MCNTETDGSIKEYSNLYKIVAPELNTQLVDFTKKLMWNNNRQMIVTVVGPTNRGPGHQLIKLTSHPNWEKYSEHYIIVDQYGNDIEHRDGTKDSRNFNRVFNPPEEKYNTLMLYRHKLSKGRWYINGNFEQGRGVERQYLQRSVAEKHAADRSLITDYECKLITVDPI